MNYSTQFIAQITSILVVLLPLFGVQIGSEQLTITIQTIILLITAVYTMYARTFLKTAPMGIGDVTGAGVRK